MQKEQLAYRLRPATIEDMPALVDLANAADKAIDGTAPSSVDMWKRQWSSPGFDMSKDTCCVLHGEQPVGVAEVWNTSSPFVETFTWFRADPEYRYKGVHEVILEWAEARAREKLPQAPAAAKVIFASGCRAEEEDMMAVFSAHGMKETRRFFRMRINFAATDIQPPTLPEGVTIRPMNMETEREAVYWAVEDSFKDHWGHVETPFEEAYPRFVHHNYEEEKFDPSLYLLAEVEGEIAAICLCRPESHDAPEAGYVRILGTRREYRRRGIGKALLLHSFALFKARGKAAVELGVDANSLTDATKLYRSAGMVEHRTFTFWEKTLRDGRDYMLTTLEDES